MNVNLYNKSVKSNIHEKYTHECALTTIQLLRNKHERNGQKHAPPNKTRGRIHLKRSVQTTGEDMSCSSEYTSALLELQTKKITIPVFASCEKFHFYPRVGGHERTVSCKRRL